MEGGRGTLSLQVAEVRASSSPLLILLLVVVVVVVGLTRSHSKQKPALLVSTGMYYVQLCAIRQTLLQPCPQVRPSFSTCIPYSGKLWRPLILVKGALSWYWRIYYCKLFLQLLSGSWCQAGLVDRGCVSLPSSSRTLLITFIVTI